MAAARALPPIESQDMAVADVFEALAVELQHARAVGLRVEEAICSLAAATNLDVCVVQELQRLDMVLQHLAALQDFAAELGVKAIDAGAVPVSGALSRVTLADVKARLGRQDPPGDGADESWEVL